MKKQLLISLLAAQLILGHLSFVGLAQPFSSAPPLQQQPATPKAETQQPRPSEEDTVRITTNLVQVDAVVTDGDGKPVTDLRPDELQILEDGKQQKITNLSYVALDSVNRPAPAQPIDKNAPPVPPVRLRPDQVHRTMALVVDDLGLSFPSAHFVRQALKTFLDKQMQPDDLVAIIRTGGGMGALQQFTSDKRQLYAAVEKVKWNPSGRGGVAAFAPISHDGGTAPNRGGNEADRADTSRGGTVDEFREDLFAVGTLGAVNYIVRGLRDLPGRKSILLISDGLTIFHKSDVSGSTRILTALQRLTDLANRASVVIYTMDARGLQTLGFTAADSTSGLTPDQVERSLSDRRATFFESQDGLNYLAAQTGGFAIRNNNDLAGGIKRVIEDQRGYYLIGYRPDESTFDPVSGRRKFHKLSLKVTRPGKFKVRMRNGFFGVTDSEARTSVAAGVQPMIGALTSPFGSAGVRLRLTTLFANDAKAGSFMRSMVHINARDLTFTAEPDGWHKAVFDILAITFGDNGMVVDQIGRTETIRVKGESYDNALKNGMTYHIMVPVKKAGAYQLRAALRDVPSARIGSASQFIEVGDIKKDRLMLSGTMVRGVSLQEYQKGELRGQSESTADALDEENPQAGPAVRQFKSGLIAVYGLAIYNARLDKATAKPQLQTQVKLFRDGREAFVGKELPFDSGHGTDPKRLMMTGAIRLGADMQPGEYVLQVIVTDLLRKDKYRVATQWIDFEVVK